jgi:signal peptidase II
VRANRTASGLPGWAAALAVAGVVVALDQASKAAIHATIDSGERVSLLLGIDLVNVSNSGIAFGFLGGDGDVVLAITIGALVAMLVWFAATASRPGLWLPVGLLTGGALGNLADRARIDAVTDFIDPPLWPAFNVADIAITLGAATLVLIVFVGDARPGGESP